MSSDSTSERLLTPAVRSGIMGALLVGTATALIAFSFIGPVSHYAFDLFDTLLVGVIGSVFGLIAGAVAGADEEHQPPAPATATATLQLLEVERAKPSMTPAPARRAA
ncbi:hypothetical protein [Paraliomyxa miuraensis]|uniref:hypothetical protein n=1 Tax=Paraliomyxa miuraensis TaxID=376150 RepID=UPI00225551B1|nr:hypothetical protein [Paraliomyxa miuraensis]MCX4246609.1 hypothetical protein [Paraliomyxa miuraensis]